MVAYGRPLRLIGALLGAVFLTGCATGGTRSGQLGMLNDTEHLVTLVITEDTKIVRGECPMGIPGNVLGCQTSRPVKVASGGSARAVKIVRFTDRVPSAMAFEIDIHELCHAVAALQSLADPCHIGNGGVVQHYPAAAPRTLFSR